MVWCGARKGRWAMIGLRTGNWRFTIEAPGFATFEAVAGYVCKSDAANLSNEAASEAALTVAP